jgi:uncharacterized repeat protein (TIGR01451 family)
MVLMAGMLVVAGGANAANPSATLDQCANGPTASPTGCNPNTWVNGNLGASKAHYLEGDSVPYRMTFLNLVTVAQAPSLIHHLTIEWDTTKSGKHALDYLTSWNRTVTTANPCAGVSGCTLGSPSTPLAIPTDPQVTGAGVAPIAGNFNIWGGTLTSITATPDAGNADNGYTYSNGTGFAGDKSASIQINFTATVANPVIAWGGHIATRLDWGTGSSAVAIAGSPFHMRLVSLDGAGGNQDRSLSNDAVTFPGSITIIKDATPNGATSFAFTASPSPLTGFNLVDNGTSSNTRLFSGITSFVTYTVAETGTSGWDLTSRTCTGFSNGGSFANNGTTGVDINLKEGENVTCTFANAPTPAPSLSIDKSFVSVTGGTANAAGDVIAYSVLVTNTGNVTLTGVSVSDPLTNGNLDCDAASGQQTSGLTIAVGGSITCTGSYTLTQTDLNNNGGGDGDIDNTATADSDQTGPSSDSVAVPLAAAPSLSITKDDNYADGVKFANVGDVITYTVVVTNTGNTDLTTITVTDTQAPNLDCDPNTTGYQTTGFTILVGSSLSCTATHTVVAADLVAGSVYNQACADDGDGGAASKCDDVTTPGKAQPTINTADTLIPQDSITLAGLSGVTTGGDLYVELRINDTCGNNALPPAYSKTWADATNGVYDTANTVAVSTDATIRWCTSYSGNADNAARPLSSRSEIVNVDFDPTGVLAGFGLAVPMLLWGLWNRKRRNAAE